MARKASKRRAPNGAGTIRQRKDGVWEARYTAPDGRQKSIYSADYDVVKDRLRKAQAQVTLGIWDDPQAITVADWLHIWLCDYTGHTTGQTKEAYERLCEKRFIPALGNLRVQAVTPAHVRHMLGEMQKGGKSVATITQARAVLGCAMRAAIEAGIIKDNPVDKVKVARKDAPRFTIIDRDRLAAFAQATQETEYPNELLFLLMTGLRVGELRGLRWSDWNQEDSTLAIQRQLHAPSSTVREFRQPKSNERRTIQLPQEAVSVLVQQRKRQAEQRLKAGANWTEDEYSKDLIFRQSDGRSHYEYSIYHAVKVVGRIMGLEGLHPHDLRHSYAVAALRSGADIKAVQNNLGHRSASVTLDIYAGYTSDMGKTCAERFSEYWQNAMKPAPLG